MGRVAESAWLSQSSTLSRLALLSRSESPESESEASLSVFDIKHGGLCLVIQSMGRAMEW